jgi:hypothetical protein
MPPPAAIPVLLAKVVKLATELAPAIIYAIRLYRSKR